MFLKIPWSHQVHFSIVFNVKMEIYPDRRERSLDSGQKAMILLDYSTLLKSPLKNIFLFKMKHNLGTSIRIQRDVQRRPQSKINGI